MSQQEALFLLCGYPMLIAVIFALLCSFWRTLVKTHQDNDSRRFPRYSPKPGPADRFRPFRRHPDMLDDTDIGKKE
jgi:hypothetical protein